MELAHKYLLSVMFFSAVLIAGCGQPNPEPNPNPGPGPQLNFKEIPRFANEAEMQKYFAESQKSGRNYGAMDMIARGLTGTVMAGVAMPMMATSVAMEKSDSGSGSSDFSKTNVQVEGVDEADIVKSDGRYIYTFSKNSLVIVDAYPAEDGKIVSVTKLDDLNSTVEDYLYIYPIEMFVSENKLLLFGSKSNYGYYGGTQATTLKQRYYYGNGSTVAQLYDITDKRMPRLEKEIEFEGSYLTSRLVGDNAIFVVNSHPGPWPCGYGTKCLAEEQDNSIIPKMMVDAVESPIARPGEIGYIYPMPARSFVTLVSFNLSTKEMEKETIAGSADNVFASSDNIYLGTTAWLPRETPIIKENQMIKGLESAFVGDLERTVVSKFNFTSGKIKYVGQGTVPGHVLNQFSMDEFEGNFRVATTVGEVWDQVNASTNNIYVLDKDMKTIGSLERLAPGEKIYSARFMGKKAYLVTFKKVDPLFVIDMSRPESPKVLGKLKIPGYSDYLHPIDETHIIGIGKDTIESGYGNFAWYQGMKMAIFDVSDVENPKEMHKIIIGDRGTNSFALENHKAFLYDKAKELLVLPIELHEIKNKEPTDCEGKVDCEPQAVRSPQYGEATFQGAFVYRVTLEKGFEERGRITHESEEDSLKRGDYYYGTDYVVKRSLYIGNVLYTLSDKMLKANALDTLKEIKEFRFEAEPENY